MVVVGLRAAPDHPKLPARLTKLGPVAIPGRCNFGLRRQSSREQGGVLVYFCTECVVAAAVVVVVSSANRDRDSRGVSAVSAGAQDAGGGSCDNGCRKGPDPRVACRVQYKVEGEAFRDVYSDRS